MKITTHRDPALGTVQIVMDMHMGADVNEMADQAWRAVYRAMVRTKRTPGTVPTGRSTPITE